MRANAADARSRAVPSSAGSFKVDDCEAQVVIELLIAIVIVIVIVLVLVGSRLRDAYEIVVKRKRGPSFHK